MKSDVEERREFPLGNLSMRDQGQTGVRGRILEGLAMPVNKLSQDLGGFRERVAPEAIQEALEDEDSDVVALFNNRPDHILGRQRAGTLSMHEDYDGLCFRAKLPETGIALIVAESVRRRDITGSSIAFIVGYDSWAWENGTKVRTIESFKTIVALGPATFPAYEQSTVSVRALEKARELSSIAYAEARLRNTERKIRHGLMTRAVCAERSDARVYAIHEAGHAVAYVVRGLRVTSVELKFAELQPGVSWDLEGGTCYSEGLAASLMDRTVGLVAGDVAESIDSDYKPLRDPNHTPEYREAVQVVGKYRAKRARREAFELLTAHWGAVEAVARALLVCGELSGAWATDIIHDAGLRLQRSA